MRTVNHIQISTARRFYPRGLLGEMLLGVLVSMVIGIGFSILAAALILILAGGSGRIEFSPASENPPFTIQFTTASQIFFTAHK